MERAELINTMFDKINLYLTYTKVGDSQLLGMIKAFKCKKQELDSYMEVINKRKLDKRHEQKIASKEIIDAALSAPLDMVAKNEVDEVVNDEVKSEVKDEVETVVNVVNATEGVVDDDAGSKTDHNLAYRKTSLGLIATWINKVEKFLVKPPQEWSVEETELLKERKSVVSFMLAAIQLMGTENSELLDLGNSEAFPWLRDCTGFEFQQVFEKVMGDEILEDFNDWFSDAALWTSMWKEIQKIVDLAVKKENDPVMCYCADIDADVVHQPRKRSACYFVYDKTEDLVIAMQFTVKPWPLLRS